MKSKLKIPIVSLITAYIVLFSISCSDSTSEENENSSSNEPSVYVQTIELKEEEFAD